MKFPIPRLASTILVCCSVLCAGRVLCAPPAGTAPEIPGSATMPPKTIESPLPPPTAGNAANAKVVIWIKEDGAVGEVDFVNGTKEWRETVIETIKRWRFEPVIWEGKPIAARTEVVLTQRGPKSVWFSMSPLPNLPGEVHAEDEFELTSPLLELDPDLILPLMVRSNGQQIEVAISYVIIEDGTTDRFEILGASSEGAVRSALDIIAQRKYRPAKVREQSVAVQYRQVFSFRSLEQRVAALKGAVDIVDPAYPFERLLAREEGNATVRFTLGTKGEVKSTELLESSAPDFGGALIAAVESWTFSPEAVVEQNVREYRHDFVLSNSPYAARRLMAVVREGKKISNAAAGLDAKPKMLARPALAFPTVLYSQEVSGSAKIEFVIDRVGLAQVPRVVDATRPEFGWAAVTLVNGMRFQPLTRGGKPTELRVVMPISFEPPKTSPTP